MQYLYHRDVSILSLQINNNTAAIRMKRVRSSALVIFSLTLYSAYAAEERRQVESIKELIQDRKAQNNNVEIQEDSDDGDEIEKALAQLFSQMLEEQAMVQDEGGDDRKRAETEGFFSFFRKIGRWFKKAGKKIKHGFKKVKRFFHRRRG